MLPEFSPRIPTTRKAHLPPGFAYPLGAGPVSDCFLSLPQFEKFTLSFSNVSPLLRPPLRVPGFPLLRLTYSNYPEYVPRNVDPGDQARTYGGERWHIEVLPTPVERRLAVQQLLLEQGIALLRDWVSAAAPTITQSNARQIAEVWHFYDTGAIKLHIVNGHHAAEEKPVEV